MTDKELLQQYIKDRSHAAFAELFARHRDAIAGLAAKACGDDGATPDDVVQSTFAHASQHAATWHKSEDVLTWFYRIAQSVCWTKREQKRKQRKRYRVVPLPDDVVSLVVYHGP